MTKNQLIKAIEENTQGPRWWKGIDTAIDAYSLSQTVTKPNVIRRLFLVTYLGTDENGDIVKSFEIMAKSSNDALQLIAEVSKSKEVYSAIEVLNGA